MAKWVFRGLKTGDSKKFYLRSTLTESWFTCAPESSGRRSPVCSACRSPVRSARRSLDLGQGMEQSLEIG
jgi:hypothetical protein